MSWLHPCCVVKTVTNDVGLFSYQPVCLLSNFNLHKYQDIVSNSVWYKLYKNI